MAVLRDEDVARTFLLAVIARHNRFKEAGERGVVQRPSRQFHRLRDAEALANVLDNLVRADLTLHGAGARVARFRNQGDPAGGNQQQNRKALANLDVQWMGLLSHWMDGAARCEGDWCRHFLFLASECAPAWQRTAATADCRMLWGSSGWPRCCCSAGR